MLKRTLGIILSLCIILSAVVIPTTVVYAAETDTVNTNTTQEVYFDNSSYNWEQVYCYIYDDTPLQGVGATIKFTNTLNWLNVYAYFYDDYNIATGSMWSGEKMTFYEKTIYGEDNYIVDIPEGSTKVVFNNTHSRTEELPLAGVEGYYLESDFTAVPWEQIPLTNAPYAGVQMTMDSATGFYKVDVPAELANGKVVFGNTIDRYPAYNEEGLPLNGSTMLFSENYTWEEYQKPEEPEKNLVDVSVSSVILSVTADGTKQINYNNETKAYTGFVEITGTTKENGVIVQSGEHDIILNGANIDFSLIEKTTAFDIQGTSKVNIILANNSENSLESGRNEAGMRVQIGASVLITSETSATVENTGTLNVRGGYYGAGIGGRLNETSGNITISGNAQVVANGGSKGAGIGGGSKATGGNITISGNAQVEATGGVDAAGIGGGENGAGGNITISGNAQVTALGGTIGTYFVNSSAIGRGSSTLEQGLTIQKADISIGSNAKVIASIRKGGTVIEDSDGIITAPAGESAANIITLNYETTQKGKTSLYADNEVKFEYNYDFSYQSIAFSGIDETKTYTVLLNDVMQQGVDLSGKKVVGFKSTGNITTYNEVSVPGDETLDISKSDIYLSEDDNGLTQISTDGINWFYYDGIVTIEDTQNQATTNKVTVIKGTHNVKLNGINIDVSNMSGHSAFDIQGTAKVNIILAKNSENILKSSSSRAGLQVQSGASVEINSENVTGDEVIGKLTATGGNYAAGIGGGNENSGGSITINGGTVIVRSEYGGAGIGSGYKGANGGNITINGGTVEATGGTYGAGIGGGYFGDGGNTIITGGEVKAYGGSDGAGIGGGQSGEIGTISISGGEVIAYGGQSAAGIGCGSHGTGGTITISGNAVVTAVGGKAYDSRYNSPYAIGRGSYNIGGSVEALTISIGSSAKVTAIAKSVGVAIDNNITAPEGEEVANIIQLYYKDLQTGKTQLLVDNEVMFEYNLENEYRSVAFSGIDANKTYTAKLNDKELIATNSENVAVETFVSTGNVATYDEVRCIPTSPTLDIARSDIYLKEVNGQNYYSNDGTNFEKYLGDVTITQSTQEAVQNKIVVLEGTLNVTLSGININGSTLVDFCAFDIQGSSNVNLTLKENTTNIIKSGENKAGIQVLENASLTISGKGELDVLGGTYGAGIGGIQSLGAGTIVVNDGTITTKGGMYSTGIGGGFRSGASSITINGGTITATGYWGGAGIGSGFDGDVELITINGGIIESTGSSDGAGIGGGNMGIAKNIVITGGEIVSVGFGYGSGIGSGNTVTRGEIAISKEAKVTAVPGYTNFGRTFNDNDGIIEAPTGYDSATIIEFLFENELKNGTIVYLLHNDEVVSSYEVYGDRELKVAFTGLDAQADYQIEVLYAGQTTTVKKFGIIEGETVEKDTFNTEDRQTTKVTIEDVVYFFISNEMLNNGWSNYVGQLRAVTDSGEVLKYYDGISQKYYNIGELEAFGKKYNMEGIIMKADVLPTFETITFYVDGQEGSQKLSTPAMNVNDVYGKVIYIGDFVSYDSQTVDPSTLIKELRYNVNIDYPNENGLNGQNIVSDTLYIGTDVRQFAISESRYKEYSFNAFDGGSTILDRDIELIATSTDKTYNLSLPVETLESSYPNLYSNATLEAISQTLIYAISVDGSQTIYDVYDDYYVGFETQYTANMAYGKTVWIKAPQTVTSGEFVGWYNIDDQKFVSYENEYKFIVTQNIYIIPVYSDNYSIVPNENPYAVSENALYETYVDSFGVTKIKFTTPLTYFPQNVDGASLKVRYQVALNDEWYDLNGEWIETDLTSIVNAQNRVNFYLTADYYNTDGSNNEMTIYIQPYVEYNNGTEIVDTKSDTDAITIVRYEYPVY